MTNDARPSVAWAVLAAAGAAATLAVVQAGPLIGYQHYLPPWLLTTRAPLWALAVLVVEGLAVAAGLWRHREVVTRALRTTSRGRIAVLMAVCVMTSATLSRDPTQYAAELLFASLIQLLHLGTVVLFAMSLPTSQVDRFGAWLDRWLGTPSNSVEPGGPDRFAWLLAGAVTAVAALLAIVSYQRHPHVPDEVVYVLQARYLAAGRLTLPLPLVPAAFDVDLMLYQSARWFSSVPPGWPFILAIGALVRLPWLVNPLLGGATILLTTMVLRELYSRRTARIASLLLATSPWALFLSMSFMTHTATLAAALVGALGVARMRRVGGLRWAVLSGLGIGVVGLIRPLDGLAVAAVLGLWSLGARGTRVRFGPSIVMTVVTMCTGALVLPYNWYLMGAARAFPVMAYFDAAYGPGTNALGFGPNRGMHWAGLDPLPGHGLLDILINANFNLFQLNTELFGWATGSLLMVLLLPFLGRLQRADWGMIGAAVTVAGAQSVYWFSGGPDFGARYWFLVIVPCVALAARALDHTPNGPDAEGATLRLRAGASLLMAMAVLLFIPWRAADKYYHYRGMRPDVRAIAADPALEGGMVLIRGARHPDYASAVIYNPLDEQTAEPLIVWDRSDSVRRALVERYPTRHFWIVDGPTVTGDGYRVVAGPLSGPDALRYPAPSDSTP